MSVAIEVRTADLHSAVARRAAFEEAQSRAASLGVELRGDYLTGPRLVGDVNGRQVSLEWDTQETVVVAPVTIAPTTAALSREDEAVDLASNGWPVFPLGQRKTPRIPTHPECKASGCVGGCGRDGHGVKDGTTDLDTVRRWWGTEYPYALIGARVPDALLVLDIDPRHGGDHRLAALEALHGELPVTLTVWSGREDGGRHLYFLRPAGKLSEAGIKRELRRVGVLDDDEDETGIDLKAAGGSCVMPPSPHPATGLPYRWDVHPPAVLPAWMVGLLVQPEPPKPLGGRSRLMRASSLAARWLLGDGVADAFCDSHTWDDVLSVHGWECLDPDGGADGARWKHPSATSAVSATDKHGCLFVYSSNTPFDVTTGADPHGYTRFRAYAVLDHAGDLSEAARHLRGAGL